MPVDPVVSVEPAEPPDVSIGNVAWWPIVGSGLAMLTNVGLGYELTEWSCLDRSRWALHATAVVSLLVCIGLWLLARRTRLRLPERSDERHGAGSLDRARFLARLGEASSLFFALMVVAQWTAIPTLHPCAGT
jgi:hypothetical protein